MFREMKNIDTAFRQVRLFTMVVVIGSIVISCAVIFKAFTYVNAQGARIYILYNGKLLEAQAIDRKQNIPLEIKDHVMDFHHYFFTLSPDEKSIQKNVRKALYLADASAKKIYDDLKEKGYYAAIISGNVSQRLEIDSIALKSGKDAFLFSVFCQTNS